MDPASARLRTPAVATIVRLFRSLSDLIKSVLHRKRHRAFCKLTVL
jgi:hypothetical protein